MHATTAAPIAASSGQRTWPRLGRFVASSARPAPTHAPAMTIETRGRMNWSAAILSGRKTVGSRRAMTAGSQPPRRSEIELAGGLLGGICSL